MSSGAFSLGFSTGFPIYSGHVPSGVLEPPLLGYYWLNDFNKYQEISSTWNK